MWNENVLNNVLENAEETEACILLDVKTFNLAKSRLAFLSKMLII